ncbi:zf-TFIIB domain-containing protein [Patescibacteria group bacterium]|nr:zf-TFIIB domain-containing protein [Patescibacteria group bacterium]
MQCPICKKNLSSTILCNVEVNYCPKCLGLWFEEEELRWAKDEKDRNLGWLDIDLWRNKKKLKISYGMRLCPSCRVPLYEVYYGDSRIIVDVCNLCRGVWLDRAEFKKIIDWLKERADYEILNNYAKNLFKELSEIFTGPETLREEILDFLTILKLLRYKFATQHPAISKIILQLPK